MNDEDRDRLRQATRRTLREQYRRFTTDELRRECRKLEGRTLDPETELGQLNHDRMLAASDELRQRGSH